jgi:hypothetical protein
MQHFVRWMKSPSGRALIAKVDAARTAAVLLLPPAVRMQHHPFPPAFNAASSAGNNGAPSSDAVAASILAGSCTTDFRCIVSAEELVHAIGSAAASAIRAALHLETRTGSDDAAPAYCLRRTEATGRVIPFHIDDKRTGPAVAPNPAPVSTQSTDMPAANDAGRHRVASRRTVQVPLSADTECTGGRLIFAGVDGHLLQAVRARGTLLAHGANVVHGVTRLVSGVRYGLYGLSK